MDGRYTKFAEAKSIQAVVGAHGKGRSTSVLFNFSTGSHPGKGEDVWIDLGELGWARLTLVIVIGSTATYEAVEWRSAEQPSPPPELLWSVSSIPPQGGTSLA